MAESYSITAILKAKVDGLVSGFKQAEDTVNSFVKKNEATFDSFKKVGAAATAGGIAVAGGLAFAVKKAADFEAGMSKVAAVSGATGKDLDNLTATAREWGSSTSFSATEAAAGMEKLALAGWDTKQIMGGIGPVLHLAEAGNLALDRSAELVTNSMAGMKLEVKDLDGYLDKVATTAANADTDIDQLMEAFVVAGGTFERLNIPLEESSALLGIMADNGFKGSEAGTAMNAIMSRLTSSTGPAADALKDMGVNAFDAEGNFRGMETVMMEVSEELATMTDKERENALEKIAGLNHGKAFNAMLDITGDKYGDLKGKIENSSGALKEMRDIMKDNLQGALENLSSAFEDIAISIGDALLPYVKKMAEFVQALADKFIMLDDKTKTIIAIIAALSAAFLLLVGPIFLLIGFIPSMLAGFTALTTVIAAISGPVVLAVAAIIAIGAALVIAYNKFEWFRDVVDAVWQAIVSVIMSAVDGVVAFVQDIATQISTYWNENGELIRSATENVWNAIKAVIETVMPIIQGVIQAVWFVIQTIVMSVWENIKGVIQGALDVILGLVKVFAGLFTGNWQAMWDGVKQLFSGAVTLLWNLVQLMLWGKLLKGIAVFAGAFRGAATTMWGAVRGVFTSAITAIRNFFTNGFNAMRNVANTSMSSIRSLVTTIWNAIRNTFTTVVNGIKNIVTTGFSRVVSTIKTKMTDSVNAVKGAVSKFFSAGKDLIQGLIDGIKNMGAAAIGAITGVVDGVVNKAKSLLGIKSPSRVFMAIGEDTGEGWAIGIDSTKEANQRAIEGVAKVITNAANAMNKEINSLSKKQATDEKAIIDKKNRDIANIRAVAANKKRKLTLQEAQRIQKLEIDASSKILDIRKKSAADIAKVEAKSSKDRIEALKLYVKDKKSAEQLSATEEAAIWKESLKKFKQGTKERVEAQQAYQKATEAVNKERLNDIKLFIDDKKSMEELSLIDEARIWEQAIGLFEEGTKERVDTQKAYKNAVEAVNKEIISINTEFADKMQKINDELAKNEQKLNDEYNKAYESRVDAIRNFTGMFDEFVAKTDKSGRDLLNNLRSQVVGLEEWRNTLESLWGKIDDQALMEELEALGPKAAGELKALNSLSETELAEYVALYNEKFTHARDQATHELAGLKEDTETSIIDMREAANKELDVLQKEWTLKIKSVTKATDDELKTLKQVGVNAGQGLLNGLASMEGALLAKARSIANAIKREIQSALDINSPSRWMRDMIGKNMMIGWIDGMEAMKEKVVAMAVNATSWMKPDVPVLAGVNVPSFPQMQYQGKSSDTRDGKSDGGNSGGDLIQHIVINSPDPTSPSENARKIKQASRDLLTEWSG